MGIAIGLNLPIRKQEETQPEEILPNDIEKLKEELVVYKNLKESLLADVKYWRDKAKK
jgi:hypothetical protein